MPDQFVSGDVYQASSLACINDLTPPTFAGIATLVANLNGSLGVTWPAATETISPLVHYDVYIQLASEPASNLFNSINHQSSTHNLEDSIYTDSFNEPLVEGVLYRVGVRARDAVGNEDSNTVYLEAVSLGVLTESLADLMRKVNALVMKQPADLETEVSVTQAVESAQVSPNLDVKVSLEENVSC